MEGFRDAHAVRLDVRLKVTGSSSVLLICTGLPEEKRRTKAVRRVQNVDGCILRGGTGRQQLKKKNDTSESRKFVKAVIVKSRLSQVHGGSVASQVASFKHLET